MSHDLKEDQANALQAAIKGWKLMPARTPFVPFPETSPSLFAKANEDNASTIDYSWFLNTLSFKSEFELKKITFNFVPVEIFLHLQFVQKGRWVLLYRSVYMLYIVCVFACSIRGFHHIDTPNQKWHDCLRNWNLVFLTAHSLLAYVFVLANFLHTSKLLPLSPSSYSIGTVSPEIILPSEIKREINEWYFKVDWLCWTLTQQLTLLVAVIFFFSILPLRPFTFLIAGDFHTVWAPCVLVFTESLLTCLPVRLAHVLYAWHIFAIFTVVSIFSWLFNIQRPTLYEGLIDWNWAGHSLLALLFVFLCIQPSIQLLHYGIFRLKITAYMRWSTERKIIPVMPL